MNKGKDLSKIYELYTCSYEDKIVYIGEGIKGRHRHCNSGCSHVYELNKIHFLEGSEALSVVVIEESTSKSHVTTVERGMIKKFDPIFNKNHTKNSDPKELMAEGKLFRKDLKFYGFNTGKTIKSYTKYDTLCQEFVDYFGYSNIKAQDFSVLSSEHYSKIGKDRIASLSRWLRESRTSGKINNTANSILFRYFKEVLNIDLRDKLSTNN